MEKFGLFLFLGCLTIALNGQNDPVEWSFTAEKGKKGEFQFVGTAKLQPGWYIYSQFIGDDGPVPTSFAFDENSNYTLAGKAAEIGDRKEGYDELFDMQIVKFGNQVAFSQPLKLLAKSATIKGSVEYMTCDDQKCLPPKSIDFNLSIPE